MGATLSNHAAASCPAPPSRITPPINLLRASPSRITPPLRPQCRDAQRVAPATPWGVSVAAKPSQKSKTSSGQTVPDNIVPDNVFRDRIVQIVRASLLPCAVLDSLKIGMVFPIRRRPTGYPGGVSTLAGTRVQGFEFHESTPLSNPVAPQIKLQA